VPQEYLSIVWLAVAGVFVYFMMIRPQRKQQKERQSMMGNLKKGDRVVTVGGLYGIVRGIKEERITLEIASEVYVQFTKAAIGNVLKSDAKTSAKPEPDDLDDDVDDIDDIDESDYEIEQDKD
jgi:preprotein translocase subunit YajC